MDLRIRERKDGKFVVEYLHRGCIFSIWKPYVTYTGIDVVYPFSDLDIARQELLRVVEANIQYTHDTKPF